VKHKYVLNLSDVPAYHPANHTGTTNRRLIGPETVGARQIELLHGTIEPGAGAVRHAHPFMEQVCWVLEGQADVEIGEERARIGPGDCCYFPPGVMHLLTVTGERPLKLLVIYTPPYGEDPQKVVRA
jgi:mannose-6-phosphate isomerase-like protein (cupin superfamily)